jgi:hypothetical protein
MKAVGLMRARALLCYDYWQQQCFCVIAHSSDNSFEMVTWWIYSSSSSCCCLSITYFGFSSLGAVHDLSSKVVFLKWFYSYPIHCDFTVPCVDAIPFTSRRLL